MEWTWVAGGLVAWLVAAFFLAVGIGRGVRLADRRDAPPGRLTTAAAPDAMIGGAVTGSPARVRRRAVPLPPVAVALAGIAVTLQVVGYVLALTGRTRGTAALFSMDAPHSVPRLLVAALFATAAVAAVTGAARNPGRRTWWLAVGCVAGGVASVKAGGTTHSDVMEAAVDRLGPVPAIILSIALVGAVVAGLFYLSRYERRDRRRVLGSLAAYGGAAVGLAALSELAPGSLAVTATFLEESGEALAGVAFLVAVLVGVAPALVLPAGWALRRSADALPLPVESVQQRAGGRTG